MGPQTVLTTRRLRLRTWRRGDWKVYHEKLNTDAVMAWLGGRCSPRQMRREIDWYIRHFHRHQICFFAVERKKDGAFVGFCGLIRVGEIASPIRGQLEIGWRVRDDMWRRGYAAEAAAAVLRWAAMTIPHQTVFARINIHNAASLQLARKLGMRRVEGGDHTHPADGMRLAIYSINPVEGCERGQYDI